MEHKKIRAIGAGFLVAVWLCLTLTAWFSPAQEISEAERRQLAQFPELSVETVLNGKFMSEFETYTLDQFPGRDSFRQLKSIFHYYGLGQLDNNDIYLSDGYAAKLEYPLNEKSVAYATDRFNYIYEQYLKNSGSSIYTCVVPDKSYYLAGENGYPALDYEAMFEMIRQDMSWSTYVDITDCLGIQDYYRTDTHWRQENLLSAAQKLAQAMGVEGPVAVDFTKTKIEKPFYGVYYGQAALPMAADELFVMESDLLKSCTVFSYEDNGYFDVYDEEMLDNRDLYDVFLGGAKALLTIENPQARTDKELIVFRDSFGSSLVPLLVQDYKTVTLVDIRYLNSQLLGQIMDFHGQDVLFLYSTLVLNSSSTLK